MAYLLNIQSSPRGAKSASITPSSREFQRLHLDATVDTLNVFAENLPDFDGEAIFAKYCKGAAGEAMEGAKAAIWQTIETRIATARKQAVELAQTFWRARVLLRIAARVQWCQPHPMTHDAHPVALTQDRGATSSHLSRPLGHP